MLGLLKRICGNGKRGPQDSPECERDEARIALCVLLLEAAHVDGECSKDELAHITTTLTERFGVAEETIDQLVSKSNGEREEAVDLFRFTRYMNNHYSKEEKCAAMEAVWQVILTDGRLEAHEDHFAHKLANLLRLSHAELIETKLTARKQLAAG